MMHKFKFFKQIRSFSTLSKLSLVEKSEAQIPLWRWIDIDYARTQAYVNGQWVDLSDGMICRPLLPKKGLNAMCDELRNHVTTLSDDQLQESCPVCLDAIDDDSNHHGVILVLECKHPIHEECLRNMVNHGYGSCSLCRTPLKLTQNVQLCHGFEAMEIKTVSQ